MARKWPTENILSKISYKNKVAYRSEMARNAFKSEFRTSKMGAGGHFVKYFETKVSYWSEMPSKVSFDIQNDRRQPFWTKITKINIMALIWNGKKWFLDIQKWLPAANF